MQTSASEGLERALKSLDLSLGRALGRATGSLLVVGTLMCVFAGWKLQYWRERLLFLVGCALLLSFVLKLMVKRTQSRIPAQLSELALAHGLSVEELAMVIASRASRLVFLSRMVQKRGAESSA